MGYTASKDIWDGVKGQGILNLREKQDSMGNTTEVQLLLTNGNIFTVGLGGHYDENWLELEVDGPASPGWAASLYPAGDNSQPEREGK